MRPLLLLSLALALSAISSAQAQDVAAGEKLFLQCRACHQVGDTAKNAVGPVLNGLFGRKAGMVEGFTYSPANKNSGLTWGEATFREYIKDPKSKIPGTKMVYPGVKDEKKVDDLIAYLHRFDKAPVKLAQWRPSAKVVPERLAGDAVFSHVLHFLVALLRIEG